MRELIIRWCQLEPDRVTEFDDDGYTAHTIKRNGSPLSLVGDDYPLDSLDAAVLLSAAIEAIEAHKGRFTLKRDIGDSHYFAAVRFQSQKTPRIAKSYQPAAALLLAYLAALEAEAGS